MISQTAPVYAAKVGGATGNRVGGGGGGGGMTRRTGDLPVRRTQPTAPTGLGLGGGIAVQGLGGLRVIKANQAPLAHNRGRGRR